NDERVTEAQQLFWQIETLRTLGVPPNDVVVIAKLHQMARLHEERAKDLLGRQDADGWTDLFAAITALGEAGEEAEARALLRFGMQAAQHEDDDGREAILSELGDLESWLNKIRSMPASGRRPLSLAASRPSKWTSP